MYEKTVTVFNYYESATTGDALTSLRTREQSLKSTDQTQLTTHSYTFDTLSRMAI